MPGLFHVKSWVHERGTCPVEARFYRGDLMRDHSFWTGGAAKIMICSLIV